jgi:hypothetical protein
MKKFIKQVNKSVKSGADTIINAADLLVLDNIVTQILRKIKHKILSYDYSTISSKEELPSLAEPWFEEGYQEYDNKVGITTEEKSNIAVRRRNLRRGFTAHLELFNQTYDEYQNQSQEKILEMKSIETLMTRSRDEVKRYETSVTNNGTETPDIVERNYTDFQKNLLQSFRAEILQLNLVHLDQETVERKTATFYESLEEMKNEFIEKRIQV